MLFDTKKCEGSNRPVLCKNRVKEILQRQLLMEEDEEEILQSCESGSSNEEGVRNYAAISDVLEAV